MNLSDAPVVASPFSRRGFFRLAAGASALATLPILTESHLALAQRPHFADPFKGIHIDANENPLGPSEAARKAAADIIPWGGRYLFTMEMDLTETFAKIEGLSSENVMAFAGSSDPLTYAVLLFGAKDRPVVIADPGYEAPAWAAKAAGYPVIQVPLADPKGEAKHDVKAMLVASANPGAVAADGLHLDGQGGQLMAHLVADQVTLAEHEQADALGRYLDGLARQRKAAAQKLLLETMAANKAKADLLRAQAVAQAKARAAERAKVRAHEKAVRDELARAATKKRKAAERAQLAAIKD